MVASKRQPEWGADMRDLKHFAIAAVFALMSSSLLAQGFSLPFGSKKGGGTDVGSIFSNLTKAAKEPTEEEEIALGQEFASTLLGAKPLLAKPGVQRYVNTLGRWLASQTERPDLPWTFAVLDDGGYNAFATPGGYVFVTRGLLERMRSEAELAGVLAHEIGHVLKKHHLNAVKTGAGMALVGDLVSAKTGGNDQLKGFVKNAVLKVFASGLDQSDEFEADRIGVVIAARAGYDPFGLPSVLQVLQSANNQDANFALMFKTHPTPAARLEKLDSLMQTKFDALSHNQGKPLVERLKEFK